MGWVYIFSKFTSEALLFEALTLFILTAGYSAYWILRKRRFGSINEALPAGPVKAYLNELIGNAEQLRIQLFGLLSASQAGGSPTTQLTNLVVDPDLSKKISILEATVNEQAKNIEKLSAEKAALEAKLAEQKGAGGGSEDGAKISELQKKVEEMEGRLFEYSVIEDDLANLKRLQQENALLKSTLAANGTPIPSPDGTAPKAAAPAASAAPPAEEASPPPPSGADTSPPTSATVAPPDADAFAALSAQVDSSLQGPSTTAPADAPPADAMPPPASQAEADLVSEFEKMLKD